MLALLCLLLIPGLISGQNNCRRNCFSIYKPVCASNGATFSNICHLQESACFARHQGLYIYLAHNGTCSSGTLIGMSCSRLCDEDGPRVCGSDGIEYVNKCRFNVAHCMASQNGTTNLVTVPFSSPCPVPHKADCDQYYKNITDIAIEGHTGQTIVLNCHGYSSSSYVCTTLGTMPSECRFCEAVKKYKDNSMPGTQTSEPMILYKGYCRHI